MPRVAPRGPSQERRHANGKLQDVAQPPGLMELLVK